MTEILRRDLSHRPQLQLALLPSSATGGRSSTAVAVVEIMEPVTTSAVVQPPPLQPRRLGETSPRRAGDWRRWTSFALALVIFLAFTGCFAYAAYGARHRPRDLAYAVVVYFLLLLLICCVAKLEQLRRDARDPAGADAAAPERRRVRVALWVVSLTLANTLASRVAELMPVLAMKLVVWAVATVVVGIVFYSLFCAGDDAGSCVDRVEHGHGRRTLERALHELFPGEKV